MPPKSHSGATKRARRNAHVAHASDTHASSPQAAFPSLPNHLVVEHILRSEYFDDDADLARLPAVSHRMRETVAAMGLEFEELSEVRAMDLGCLSAVQRLQRQGRLSRQEHLCVAAVRGGHLEELKLLRENGCPRDENDLYIAAQDGHEAIVRVLIKAGADIDKAYKNGATPLFFAIKNGHEAVVRTLI